MSKPRRILFWLLAACLLLTNVSASSAQVKGSVRLADNVAKYVGSGLFEWTIFIRADERWLGQVSYVVYTLHPTFPNPVRTVRERGRGPYAFALSDYARAEFDIGILIVLKNGSSFEEQYHLNLIEKSKENNQSRSTTPSTAPNTRRAPPQQRRKP
ncbi:MAG TPA: pYEATS domain-containing protein [Pyrinomonadaceae bacterium]|jgi:transcription initiation factor IIF auxiliary subunit